MIFPLRPPRHLIRGQQPEILQPISASDGSSTSASASASVEKTRCQESSAGNTFERVARCPLHCNVGFGCSAGTTNIISNAVCNVDTDDCSDVSTGRQQQQQLQQQQQQQQQQIKRRLCNGTECSESTLEKGSSGPDSRDTTIG